MIKRFTKVIASYLQYYRVEYEQGYLIGSIPLVLTGIVMIVINLIHAFN